MIVRKNKDFEICSLYPDSNWYPDEDNYVVDETTQKGKALAQKIIENYPFYDLITENGQLVDVKPYPAIEFEIDKTIITQSDVATIKIISNVNNLKVIANKQEYEIADNVIEYMNQNTGTHIITLKAEGFKDTDIKIEVIE